MIRRLAAAAILACALTPCAVAQTASDSLDRSVAVFIASNIKLSVSNALGDIAAMGIDCDTAAVRALIAAELARPYDAAAHQAANEAIDAAMAERAVRESDAFLKAAAERPGATVLHDGLVIETLSEGTGATPTPSSTVSIRYRGTLPDGTVFDSIAEGDEPLTTPVSSLCAGMAKGLLLMRQGGRYRLTIPAPLAYGSRGVAGVIPPDCALQFEVQLTDIK